jgi:HEAT repeat protein
MREGHAVRHLRILLSLCAFAAVSHAQGRPRDLEGQKFLQERKNLQRIRELVKELRELPSKSPAGIARPTDLKRIFSDLARINHPEAVRNLIDCAENAAYMHVREELLRILADAPGIDEVSVSALMRQHMANDAPARRIARDYLLAVAKRRGDVGWLAGLFDSGGPVEDRFLAVQAIGEVNPEAALVRATTLLKDRSWRPDETGLVSCATIALSVRRAEGPDAARLLLLLTRDPRFGPADAAALREATRLWRQSDLRTYVDLAALGAREIGTRRETAAFLGAVGLEAARAPLVRVAFNAREAPEVRSAAATALGGLRIAKEDLVEKLSLLLADPDASVRRGAADGLCCLMTRQAAETLVSALDGPGKDESRAALAAATGLLAETDWAEWLRSLPRGK